MPNQSTHPEKVLGLDVGTSRVVTSRRAEEGDTYASQLNAFVTLPYTRMAEQSLQREAVPHARVEDQLVVFGNEAERVADLFGKETRRPMTYGILNPSEPGSLEHIREIIRAAISSICGEKGWQKSKVCFSIPAAPLGQENQLTYHEATLRQVLDQLGAENVRCINEGMAVVYSELEDTNFTGIGVSCGGGLCNVAVAYLSVPLDTFSVPKGGDAIDQSAAGATGVLINRVRLTKEQQFHFNGHFTDRVQQALTVFYDDMIAGVVQGLKEAFQISKNVPKIGRPLPLVLSGGSVLPEGFRDRFERALQKVSLPVTISEVRLARDPLYTTARGALIAALSE